MPWEDQWELGLSFIQISLALLLLVVPPQLLVRPRYRASHFERPWFAIWSNLAWGAGSALLAIAEQRFVPPLVRPALVIGAYASMAIAFALVVRLVGKIWRNSRRTVSPHTRRLAGDAQFLTSDTQMYQGALEDVVKQFLLDGHKIHAIKRVQDETGWRLQAAKAYVDEVEDRLEALHDEVK